MNTTISPFRFDGSRPKSEVVYTTSAQDFDEVVNKTLRLLEEEDDGAVITFGDGNQWRLIYDEYCGWTIDEVDGPKGYDVNDLQPPVA